MTPEEAEALLHPCPEGCILVSHSPPKGAVDVSSRGRGLGSTAIRSAVLARNPRLMVCGHIHVHSRTVDDRAVEAAAVRLVDLHLIQGERVADDILGETVDILTLLRQYPADRG